MKEMRFVVLVLVLSGLAMSCSTTRRSKAAYVYEFGMEDSGSDMFTHGRFDKRQEEEMADRKILYSAFLSLRVDNPDTANSNIVKIAEKYRGYASEISTYRTIIRVKSEHLEDVVQEISGLGKVKTKSLSGQDVTEEYLDYKIRLENAEKARKRYLELLDKAENVEAALQVEKELERLNETIDLLKGKMNRIDHLSEYCTITISLDEKKKPGILGYVGLGLYYSVKWLFVRN